jgi:outer membrane protein assembly factor BamB
VLVASDRGRLFCFASGSMHCWTIPLPDGPLSGTPFVQDQDIVLASVNGTVWRVAGADGKELGRLDLGEPVAVGPVPFSGLWLASGSDGTVYGFALAEPVTPPAGTGGRD